MEVRHRHGYWDVETRREAHDLISEARYLWHGESNFIQLDPFACPAHIFRVRQKIKTEQDFDYYM